MAGIGGAEEDYSDDELDTLEREDQEEAWFDAEDPDWASDSSRHPDDGDRVRVDKMLHGQTGIQDF